MYFFQLSSLTSTTVMNRLRYLADITLPYYIPDIPHDTLEWIYDFLELFNMDTDISAMNETLPVKATTDISFLLEFLYGTLIEAHYLPTYLSNQYSTTLQFFSAIIINENVRIEQSIPRLLRPVSFRNQYARDIDTDMIKMILRNRTQNVRELSASSSYLDTSLENELSSVEVLPETREVLWI